MMTRRTRAPPPRGSLHATRAWCTTTAHASAVASTPVGPSVTPSSVGGSARCGRRASRSRRPTLALTTPSPSSVDRRRRRRGARRRGGLPADDDGPANRRARGADGGAADEGGVVLAHRARRRDVVPSSPAPTQSTRSTSARLSPKWAPRMVMASPPRGKARSAPTPPSCATTGAAPRWVSPRVECRPSAPMTRHRRKADAGDGEAPDARRAAKAAGACTAHSAARCHRSNGVEAGP